MAILGIDEVGRGPWAGPLVVGAVLLPDLEENKALDEATMEWVAQLADSKKLSAKKRENLSEKILGPAAMNYGVRTGLGWVTATELDKKGLAVALRLATKRAVKELCNNSNQSVQFSSIIIDGTQNFLVGTEYEQVTSILPKADAKIKAVSAASIIAKVARDHYMKEIAQKYPEYGFDKHVGYGTKLHHQMLKQYGPCPEHRKSFRPVAEIAEQNNKNCCNNGKSTKQIGDHAEQIVADYLIGQGHKILARNYKTRFYEIDIISATKDAIYFTEVKYRRTKNHGDPLETIDTKKQKQIKFAAECFTQYLADKLGRPSDSLPKQKLAAASVVGSEYELEKWLEILG